MSLCYTFCWVWKNYLNKWEIWIRRFKINNKCLKCFWIQIRFDIQTYVWQEHHLSETIISPSHLTLWAHVWFVSLSSYHTVNHQVLLCLSSKCRIQRETYCLTFHRVQSPLKFSQILSPSSPTWALPLACLHLHCPLEGQPFPCTRILPPTMHQSNSHSSLVFLKAYVPLGACCRCPGRTNPRFLSAHGPSCRRNKVALTT